jgi:hypothetical protein
MPAWKQAPRVPSVRAWALEPHVLPEQASVLERDAIPPSEPRVPPVQASEQHVQQEPAQQEPVQQEPGGFPACAQSSQSGSPPAARFLCVPLPLDARFPCASSPVVSFPHASSVLLPCACLSPSASSSHASTQVESSARAWLLPHVRFPAVSSPDVLSPDGWSHRGSARFCSPDALSFRSLPRSMAGH